MFTFRYIIFVYVAPTLNDILKDTTYKSHILYSLFTLCSAAWTDFQKAALLFHIRAISVDKFARYSSEKVSLPMSRNTDFHPLFRPYLRNDWTELIWSIFVSTWSDCLLEKKSEHGQTDTDKSGWIFFVLLI